jgi:transcription initiation factor IIE alpha subunit
MKFGLCPVCGLQVEYDDVGEMLTVLILTAEDQEFTTLP